MQGSKDSLRLGKDDGGTPACLWVRNWEVAPRLAGASVPPRCPALPVAAEGAHAGHLPAGMPPGVDVLGWLLQLPAVAGVNTSGSRRSGGQPATATARSSFFHINLGSLDAHCNLQKRL